MAKLEKSAKERLTNVIPCGEKPLERFVQYNLVDESRLVMIADT